MEHRHRLLQIENMDTVADAKNIGTHFRVPAARLMSEMNAGFQQLAHGELWQSHVFFFSGYASAELVRNFLPDTGAADALSRRAPHIRVRITRAQLRGSETNTPVLPTVQVNSWRFKGRGPPRLLELRQFLREQRATARNALSAPLRPAPVAVF